MADSSEMKIGYTISAEDLTATGLESAKKRFKDTGKDIEKTGAGAKLAMWGLGEQAENLAQSMGVPFQMSKRLGNTFEDFSSKISPKMAIGFGAVGLAAMAAAAVYSHLAEKNKKLREETLKAADASMSWVEAARVDTRETDNLREAKDRLWEVEKRQAQLNLERGIREQTKAIEDQFALMERRRTRAGMSSGTLIGTMVFGTKATRQKDLTDAEMDYERAIAKLHIMYADAAIAAGKGTLRRKDSGALSPAFSQFEFEQIREWMLIERGKEERQKGLDSEAAYLSARAKLYQSYGSTNETQQAADLAAFDATTTAKLNAMKDEDAQREYFMLREMERQGMVVAYDRENAALRVQIAQDMATGLAQTFQLLYQASGNASRKYFEMYKAAAIAETIISTYSAAMKAYDFGAKAGPVVGAAMASIAVGAGMAKVAAIRAQGFGSGAGAGASGAGGGAGDYGSVGQNNNPYRYFNYEQSKYGSGWRPGEGQGQTNITINAVDSKSFAALCKENPSAITDVTKRAQQGYY